MHTPGPWKMLDVKDLKGNICAYSVWQDLERLYLNSPMGNQICRTPDGTTKQARANAHLIAAAPDLLAACKDLTSSIYNRGVSCQSEIVEKCMCQPCVIKRAVAAIAKAEGRA